MRLDDFKSEIGKRGGFANSNRFWTSFNAPSYVKSWNGTDSSRSINMLCESISFPGKQIESLDYSMYRNTYKVPTGYMNDELNVVFRITDDFFVKKVFDEWQAGIIDQTTYKARYIDEYAKQFTFAHESKEGNKGSFTAANTFNPQFNFNKAALATDYITNDYKINITDCYPITVGAIEKSNESMDEIMKLQVTFAYRDIIVV